MTEDLSYQNSRLVEIYDLDNPWAQDTDFYLALAEPGSDHVLDLGCGTGTLTCAFAERDYRVTGVYEVQAVFFDVPLAVCLERNSKRDRQVTDEVMHKMAERLRPPVFKEGFDKITVVRVKGSAPTADSLADPEASTESAPEAAVEG